MTTITQSLSQGKQFENYQKKISHNLEKKVRFKEGFSGRQQSNNNYPRLAKQNNKVLQQTNIDNQMPNIENLRKEFKSKMDEYNTLVKQIQSNSIGYFDRVNNTNPYLNKTVHFTTGHMAYVTNKGVVKWIPSYTIWNSTEIPTNYIDLGIPWDNSYNTPGTTIATTPPLISGTFVEMNQSIGNEGSNVFVDEYLSSSVTASYQGCYADNTTSPLMTFVGGAPPPPTTFINGNFDQPSIANNTYQYITSSSTVPGWYFSAVLVNNSSAWEFPMPYPSGSQCVSIQETQYLSQSVYLQAGVTYTLSFVACGRNCCDGSGQSNPINIQLYSPSNVFISTVYNFQPPVSVWTNYTTSFTVETSQNTQIFFQGTWTSGDRSTAIQNIQLTTSGTGAVGSYTYDQCKETAQSEGYQYFALQGVNTSSSQGYCAVSNSLPTATSLGDSTAITEFVALWATNTYGQTGNSATLTTTGALSVINSGGTSVYSSPNSKATQSSYLGCYGDTSNRAMPNTSNNQYLSFDDCKNLGAGYKYFATQNASNGLGWCSASNDLATATEYGKASNCSQYEDNWMGAGWSNAIYSTDPGGVYYFILQDDGNMCVYRGSGPNDNQGEIWCAMTNGTYSHGKAQSPNPNMTAAKGKYGKNWIASGSTLAAGDFIGSTDGSIALVMQSDGNLVLYTFKLGSNCSKMADGNTGAGAGGNALYGFNKASIPGNMGKLAYIDENSELYTYPSNNVKLVNNYSIIPDMGSSGYDIPGAAYGNSTSDQCTTTCNSNSECAGFSFYQDTCYPKYNTMFPNGTISILKGCDTYIKNREPKTPPIGVPSTTNNTDTVTYQNYLQGGQVGDKYGLSNANNLQKQQLSDLETQLNQITSQINKLTDKFENSGSRIDDQSTKTNQTSDEYVKDIRITNNKIKHFSTNMNRILDDSDIVVLQKNYDYLFWTILATGVVLISMNIVKK